MSNKHPVKSGFEENPASLTFVVTHCCCCSGSPEIRTKKRSLNIDIHIFIDLLIV